MRRGYYGEFGGRFVPETLIPALEELEGLYLELRKDPGFQEELRALLRDYSGRPTPLYYAEELTKYLAGGKVYLKRRT